MDIKEIKNHSEVALKDWREKEKIALELLQIVGELRFDRSIELVFFRRDIYDTRPSQLIQYHDWSINYSEKPLEVAQTLSLAQEIYNLKGLGPAKIDIGQLCLKWEKHRDEYKDISDFVRQNLDNMTGSNGQPIKPKDVVLYGFGRIGRLLARRIIATTGRGEQLRLKAIVLRPKMRDL